MKTLTLMNRQQFHEAIRDRVAELGLNANQISIKLGGTPTDVTVQRFINGHSIRLDKMFEILEVLGWSAKVKWEDK